MFAIYKRELRSYFKGAIGFVFLTVYLVIAAIVFAYSNLFAMSSHMTSFFTFMLLFSGIALPLLTMKSFSEERKTKTEQLLLTAPVSLTGMVLGKYFAALTMYVAGVLVSCINFLPLYIIGSREASLEDGSKLTQIGPITGQIVGGVFAVILLGAALIAVGTLISSLTENQLSSAVITVGVIAAMVLLSVVNQLTDSDGQPIIASYAIRYVIDWVSVLSRFNAFVNGIFDFAALLYYASLAFVFLFITVRVYDKRRWG